MKFSNLKKSFLSWAKVVTAFVVIIFIQDVNAQTLPKDILEISPYCAITKDKVHCWGGGKYKQSGIFKDFKNPRQIVSNYRHACLIDDDAVWCWGDNSSGQIQVPFGIKNPKQLAITDETTCVLDDEGVKCWGSYAAVMNNLNLNVGVVKKIVIGSAGTVCAIIENNIKCWGNDEYGILDVPTSRIQNPTDISINYDEVCVSDAGGIICWGYTNQFYSLRNIVSLQVPDSSNDLCWLSQNGQVGCFGIDQKDQYDVPNISNVRSLTAIGRSACASSDQGLVCWSIRDGDLINEDLNIALKDKKSLAVGPYNMCGLDTKNNYRCWGQAYWGHNEMQTGLENSTQVSVGAVHACAIVGGNVKCWGGNENKLAVTVPADLKNVTALSVGGTHTCAIADNIVRCWGTNASNQVSVPASVINPKQVSLGRLHSCALLENKVVCWGDNSSGQINVPTDLKNPKMVTAGRLHTCVVDDDGAKCWGNNELKQLDVPAGLANIKQISAGFAHTCALDEKGMVCWGNNENQQNEVPIIMGITSIQAVGNSTCAKNALGQRCWGNNDYNQLSVPEAL